MDKTLSTYIYNIWSNCRHQQYHISEHKKIFIKYWFLWFSHRRYLQGLRSWTRAPPPPRSSGWCRTSSSGRPGTSSCSTNQRGALRSRDRLSTNPRPRHQQCLAAYQADPGAAHVCHVPTSHSIHSFTSSEIKLVVLLNLWAKLQVIVSKKLCENQRTLSQHKFVKNFYFNL